MSLITPSQVLLDLPADDRQQVVHALAQTLVDDGRVTDLDQFLADIAAREKLMATGLPDGIGIPHCRSAAVTVPSLAFARSANGVDWGAADGPATLIFMIAVPDSGGEDHLAILAKLARKLMRREFKQSLRDAGNADEVVRIIEDQVVNA
ncbi:PTS system fructose-specific EIIABC component [Austwickia sp. TVS 96-490-7B]|uniref:PTS sugar transporter subunit IIA n=1 Tax=Austwickia sp. TVS 96-490-7B TaxID=2830843 RepID=UPI001C57F553|nr:fructose PTS transporter subunit IIA [Austwickia sp. TVS 96-490-7B]MBW3086144.1 PTS system fructose-specific EIIABC component [Austwickia sp. TVS 96-490-7B]